MAGKEELSGLENLLMYNELSAEEYFSLVVSSSDLDIAKTSIANVITKLRKCNGGDHAKLQDLYEDFFQTPIPQDTKSNPVTLKVTFNGPKPPSQTHHATPKQHLKKAWGVNPTTIKGPKPPSGVQSGNSNKHDQNVKSTTSGLSESKSPKLPSREQRKHIENQRSEEDRSSLKQNSYGDFYIQSKEPSQDSGNGTTDDKNVVTGKSLSEALLFAEHGENILCTKIVLNVRNNFCTQHVLPMF